jgi:hypothetical protein
MAGPKPVGAHGQTNNLAPLKTDILWTFSAWGRAGEQFLGRALTEKKKNSEKFSSHVENLRLIVPPFRLFQWLRSAPL